jgi:enterochelin esterase-like enzyme
MRFTAAALKTVAMIAVFGAAVSCARGPGPPGADDRSLESVIAEIEAGRTNTPLIVQPAPGSDATVTFLLKSTNGQVPRIVSDVTGWGEAPDDSYFDMTIGTMTQVGSTDWFRLETRVAPGARIEYLVVHGQTDYRVDPNNPRQAWVRGDHEISEFVTPDYLPPQEFAYPPLAPGGRTFEGTIDSRALGAPRRALVYLPPGYSKGGTYPVAVFHSGWGVAHEGQAPRVLDWLITRGKIEPIVGLFLESHLTGDPDNHEGPPMRAFLTEEAPAWLASRIGITARADQRAVLAISYSTKDAIDAALAPTQAYGRLGLLIPGRRLKTADLEAFSRQPGRRLQVAILAGLYDQANLATAQNARQALADAGHAVEYIEVPEGHNGTTWRDHLSDIFVSLFGAPNGRPGDQ